MKVQNILYLMSSRKLMLLLLVWHLLPFSLLSFQNSGDTLGYKILDIKKGDRCIVCDMQLKEGTGIALLFRGRRITIDLEHFQEFFSNSVKYFAKLQPNAALFSEEAVQELHIRYEWFLFGLWVTIALIAAALSSNIALRKGYSANRWFFIGLLTSVFGLIYIALQPSELKIELPKGYRKISATEAPVVCPKCGAYNHPSAKICLSCKQQLVAKAQSEIDKVFE